MIGKRCIQKQRKSDFAVKIETWLRKIQSILLDVGSSARAYERPMLLSSPTHLANALYRQLYSDAGDSDVTFAPFKFFILRVYVIVAFIFLWMCIYLSSSPYLLLNVISLDFSQWYRIWGVEIKKKGAAI